MLSVYAALDSWVCKFDSRAEGLGVALFATGLRGWGLRKIPPLLKILTQAAADCQAW